jgi:excisionase family DNA binding protein
MATKSSAPKTQRGPEKTPVGLRLSEAAALLELSPSTLRRYVKAGKLKASQSPGKYGSEYRIRPAILQAFALETLNLNFSLEDLEGVKALSHTQATPPPPVAYTELYERLIDLTAEATRYKALSEVSESTLRAQEEEYKAQIAELLMEKRVLEEKLQTLEERKRWSLFRRRST